MPNSTPERIGEAIHGLLQRPNPVLFAGAGVGCRVGYPDWDEYIEHLAATCDRFGDPESAVLMRKRLEQKNHLGAATVFKSSNLIPEGERWKALAGPFKAKVTNSVLDKLMPLVGLPFSAIVTTNYEHSLHDAYAYKWRRWVPPVERGQLRSATLSREFFVARIHGSADQPTSMAIDTSDYRSLRAEDDYLDFVLNILRARSCLFLGFSFLDPAIAHVLDLYAERFGPTYDALHTAVVPEGDQSLASRLRGVNIQTIVYDPTDNHADLWRALRFTYDSAHIRSAEEGEVRVDVTYGHGPIHRFLAFTFAQARLRFEANSIANIAQDGLVASILATYAGSVVTEDALVAEVGRALRLTPESARQIVGSSLDRLERREQILRDASNVAWIAGGEPELDQQLTNLARDVFDRMRVREGVQATDQDVRAAKLVLERVLMSRAWDIGAHFAGGNTGWALDVRELIRDALRSLPPAHSPKSGQALENALQSLLTAPDTQEALLLTELSRAAFGIQLLLASPRQMLFHKHALPRTLYLDASVLMPAITAGHPHRPAYMEVIKKLEEAARHAKVPLAVAVGYQFLNEIVSHRKLAIEIVEAARLENPENLRRHIQFYSALNTNVFVGAYGTLVGRAQVELKFDDFLRKFAPFNDENELSVYLETLGIHAVPMDFRKEHNSEYIGVLNPLKQGYEDLELTKVKPSLLVQHEAQQLTQLLVDATQGQNSIFVTADRKLRSALWSQPELRRLSGMTVSHLGLVALADVMVGIGGDARSLARLVWAAPTGDEEKVLFEYFISLGLREYHEGLATELQHLAQRSAEEARATVETERLKIFSHEVPDIERTAAFLDRFEDRFYQSWREAIERKERQN